MTSIDTLLQSSELRSLRERLERYNVFQAVGLGRAEIRHSHFLAHLFDSRQPHGFGVAFAQEFFRTLARRYEKHAAVLVRKREGEEPGGEAFEVVQRLAALPWRAYRVRRERDRRDVELIDDAEKVVVIIENKMRDRASADQLARYVDEARKQYPGYSLYGLFLWPHRPQSVVRSEPAPEPSVTDSAVVEFPVATYGDVYHAIGRVLDDDGVGEPAAREAVRAYRNLLERRVTVSDTDALRDYATLLRKHEAGIRELVQYRRKVGKTIRDWTERFVAHTARMDPNLERVKKTRSRYYIAYKPWSVYTLSPGSKSYADQRCALLFEVEVKVNEPRVDLLLVKKRDPATAETLEPFARAYPKLFYPNRLSHDTHPRLLRRTLLDPGILAEHDGDFEEAVRKRWDDFWHREFPQVDAAIQTEAWRGAVAAGG